MLLISHEVFGIVNGSETKPASPAEGADANVRTKYEKDLKEFTRKDGVAQKFIVTSIERQPMTHILNCENAKAMWDKLHAVYESKTDTSIHVLQQKWFAFVKDPKDDIATHISKIGDLCYTLRALKEEISDSMMITKILMTLPQSYNHFRSAWDSGAPDQKTVENLTSRLVVEETRMASQANSENSAFVVRGQRGTRKYSNKDTNQNTQKTEGTQNTSTNAENSRKQKGCWECGRIGHIRKNCWQLPGNERPNSTNSEQRRSNHNNTAPAITRKRDAIVGEVLITPMEQAQRTTSWLLDSGASEHMCDKREWFVTYENVNNYPIRIGDGRILYAIGKGNINILAFTGSKWEENFLANVLHVTGLKYNLFSMGTALKKNMNFESNNTECTFYRNNEIILIGSKNPEETIFTMKIEVESINKLLYTEKNVIKDNMQLWHERLAHQSFTHVKHCLENNGIDVKDDVARSLCDACALGKMHRSPFRGRRELAKSYIQIFAGRWKKTR